MKPMVDREQLHKLFLSGKPLAEIAKELGSTHGAIRTLIYQERLRNPLDWPHRVNYPGKSAEQPLMMHLYECDECAITFAVEDYEEVDHSATACPICGGEESVKDKCYGRFVPTSMASQAEAM
ncbi:hypothetical protein ACFSL6_08825 [Paenibacillus thailandensis]|uniref:Uncharacterized protein n=1 Tax=Paenibacillus thailandensis TaxID=393250 RepID=A0ABW5QSR1_9BACL